MSSIDLSTMPKDKLSELAQAAFNKIQAKAVEGCFSAAEECLQSEFIQALIPKDIRAWLHSFIQSQKKKYEEGSAEQRLQICYWIIFIIGCLITAFLLWEYGVIAMNMSKIKAMLSAAYVLIGGALSVLVTKLAVNIKSIVTKVMSFFGFI